MTTTHTPPSLPTPPRGPRASARVIAAIAIALGAVLILGTVLTTAASAAWQATRGSGSGTLSADATGIRALTIDTAAADVRIVYGGDTATLEVTDNASDWRLDRTGDTLRVTRDRGGWGPDLWFSGDDDVVLRLPSALQRVALDAEFSLSSGSLRADGAYGRLALDLSAGLMNVTGTADTLVAEVSAGRLELDLADARTAELTVSAGLADGRLTGTAPQQVSVDVSAGRADLVLPDAAYAVTDDVSAGGFSNDLREDPASRHRVSVSVGAGLVGLSSAG